MKEELLQPKEIEVEKYDEDDYDQFLDECYEEVKVAGLTFDPSAVVKEMDPTAYRCGFADFQEYETKWECPVCGDAHDDEDDALYCCQDEEEEEED